MTAKRRKFPLSFKSKMELRHYDSPVRERVEQDLHDYEDRRRAWWPKVVQKCIDPIGQNIFSSPVPCGHCVGCRSKGGYKNP